MRAEHKFCDFPCTEWRWNACVPKLRRESHISVSNSRSKAEFYKNGCMSVGSWQHLLSHK